MNTEASILVYNFRPERTGFNMYATAINFPCITFLLMINFKQTPSFLKGIVSVIINITPFKDDNA